jgi:hypothetical protein
VLRPCRAGATHARMAISLFRSTKQPDVFGFTADPSGSNLPAEFAPWQIFGGGTAAQAYAGRSLEGLAASDPVVRAIERDGFYLARSGLTIPPPQDPAASADGGHSQPDRQ